MALTVVFMGTPDFAVPTLRAVHEAGHRIAAVYTQPPRKAGRRGLTLTPSPVQQAAELFGLRVATPVSLKGEAEQAGFAALNADLAIVVAYGLILPQAILDSPRHGCLNGHASLLPRWRGAAPVQRAIEAGDRTTGVSIMGMEAGLDTGPVGLMRELDIEPAETGGELSRRLSTTTGSAMTEALGRFEAGDLTFEDQTSVAGRTGRQPSYAPKIDKTEAALDFDEAAEAVANRINAFSPFPGAFTHLPFPGGRERVKILRAQAQGSEGGERAAAPAGTILEGPVIACRGGAVRLLEVQRAGGKPMSGVDLARNAKLAIGGIAAARPDAG